MIAAIVVLTNKANILKKVVRLVSGVGTIGLEPMTSSM